jgi:hypothetical protein
MLTIFIQSIVLCKWIEYITSWVKFVELNVYKWHTNKLYILDPLNYLTKFETILRVQNCDFGCPYEFFVLFSCFRKYVLWDFKIAIYTICHEVKETNAIWVQE